MRKPSDDVLDLLLVYDKALQLITLQVSDQACLLQTCLEHCVKCDSAIATVEHCDLHVKMCDRCAAESIVSQGRTFVNNVVSHANDGLNDVRATLMREKDWHDVPNASRIRTLNSYVQQIGLFYAEPTVH